MSFCPNDTRRNFGVLRAAFALIGAAAAVAVAPTAALATPVGGQTPEAFRLRIAETALDLVQRELLRSMETVCPESAGQNAICERRTDATGSDWLHFFLGSPEAPLSFSYEAAGQTVEGTFRTGGSYALDEEVEDAFLGVPQWAVERAYCDDTGGAACQALLNRGTGQQGVCRDPTSEASGCDDPANDYCCGHVLSSFCAQPPETLSCTAPRSNVAVNYEQLLNNLHLALIGSEQQDDSEGLRITVGCPEADLENCQQSQFVDVWAEATAEIIGNVGVEGVGSFEVDAACKFREDTANPADRAVMQIKSMDFVLQPSIALRDGSPFLQVDEENVSVRSAEIVLESVDFASEPNDPACYDEDTQLPFGDHLTDCALCQDIVPDRFVSALFSGTLGQIIATRIARAAVAAFAEQPLEFSGTWSPKDSLPIVHRSAQPLTYGVGANPGRPSVTGPAEQPGWNFDFDASYSAEPSACVPAVDPQTTGSDLPPMPEPGGTVQAPDPQTGELSEQPYDVAVVAGDSVFTRGLATAFTGGAMCLYADAEQMQNFAGIAPTVELLSPFFQGLDDVAPGGAPVDVAIEPHAPPQITFGDGADVTLALPDLEVALYPLVDMAQLLTMALSADLRVQLDVEPTPTGDAKLFIRDLSIDNVAETANPMGLGWDPQDVVDVLSTFIEPFLNDAPIAIPLAGGPDVPVVPKVRAVQPLGSEPARHLGIYMALCGQDELADDTNPLCYEPSSDEAGNSLSGQSVGVFARTAADPTTGAVRLGVHTDLAPARDLELAFRIDGAGLYRSFQPVDADGSLQVRDGRLRAAGVHELEVIVRDRSKPTRWSDAVSVWVETPLEPADAAGKHEEGRRGRTDNGQRSAASPPVSTGGCSGSGQPSLAVVCILLVLGWGRWGRGRY